MLSRFAFHEKSRQSRHNCPDGRHFIVILHVVSSTSVSHMTSMTLCYYIPHFLSTKIFLNIESISYQTKSVYSYSSDGYFISSHCSLVKRTFRGLLPSSFPTIPRPSKSSINLAARLYPIRN